MDLSDGSSAQKESFTSKISTNFKSDVMKEAIKSQFKKQKVKINEDTTELMNELLKTLVVESSVRAARQAKLENNSTVTLDHAEAILPQMMLDFP